MQYLILIFILLCPQLALAQSQRNPCYQTSTATTNGSPNCVPDGISSPHPVINLAPGGAIQGNSTGTIGAVIGTLAASVNRTTYLCDFDVSAIGGTAAIGPIVVSGLSGGSKTYQLSSSAAGVTLSKSFNPCLPGSAINTAILITTTADGSASAVDVNSSGYQQ